MNVKAKTNVSSTFNNQFNKCEAWSSQPPKKDRGDRVALAGKGVNFVMNKTRG